MKFDDKQYQVLSDKTNSYSCFEMKVSNDNRVFADYLRGLFIQKVKVQGYRGYDKDFDEQYQSTATYFYIKDTNDKNEIVMIMRANLIHDGERFLLSLVKPLQEKYIL